MILFLFKEHYVSKSTYTHTHTHTHTYIYIYIYIYISKNVNRMMGLWIWTTPTVFRISLLSDRQFLASLESSGPKVTRKLFRQILTKNFHLSLQPILRLPLDSRSVFCKIIYDICFEWFHPVMEKEKEKWPNG